MAEIKTYAQPIWLYRYRSLGMGGAVDDELLHREVTALLEGYIYCANYKHMNDPMEGFFRSTQKVWSHSGYEAFAQQLRAEKLGLGIASFSETWDNELMWAHYANAFQGICVCYSMSKLLMGIPDGHAFSRVAYGNKPHLLNLPAIKNDEYRARAVLSTKHLSWAYEREWRLFAGQPGPVSHGPGAIKSVFVGARVNSDTHSKVAEMLAPLGVSIHQTRTRGYLVKKKRARSGRP